MNTLGKDPRLFSANPQAFMEEVPLQRSRALESRQSWEAQASQLALQLLSPRVSSTSQQSQDRSTLMGTTGTLPPTSPMPSTTLGMFLQLGPRPQPPP